MAELYDKDNNPIEEVYDADGNPVDEILTPDEVDQRINDAKEETKADYEVDIQDLQSKLDEKEQELKQAQEELAKAGNKDHNFKNLRDKKEEKEGEVAELKNQISELKQTFEKQSSQSKDNWLTTSIEKIAGDDKDLAEKIRFHYDQFVVPQEDTLQKQEQRLKSAYTLAVDSSGNALSSDAIASGGAGKQPTPSGGGGKLNDPGAVEVAKNLGIDEKTLRKNKLI